MFDTTIIDLNVHFKFANVHLVVIACLSVHAGAWLKSNWGRVRREGNQLILTYIAPQLGYWLAAMSPLRSGEKLNDFLLIAVKIYKYSFII